jgi:hypothetical protein
MASTTKKGTPFGTNNLKKANLCKANPQKKNPKFNDRANEKGIIKKN